MKKSLKTNQVSVLSATIIKGTSDLLLTTTTKLGKSEDYSVKIAIEVLEDFSTAPLG